MGRPHSKNFVRLFGNDEVHIYLRRAFGIEGSDGRFTAKLTNVNLTA
jgi:hypothetical protein